MKLNINSDIAFAYLISRPKQTVVASLGVTFGISMFIFMNSLIKGTNDYTEKTMLSATPHIRLYHDNELSNTQMLNSYMGNHTINLISNPQLVANDNRINNPDAVIEQIRHRPEITALSKQVTVNVIYSNSTVQQNGNLFGVNIHDQDKMFDITSTMISGSVKALADNPNGIIIGIGLSKRLNIQTGDYLSITASNGAVKRLQVAGIFKTTIKAVDESKTYVNLPVTQQLLQKDRSYITDIYMNVKHYYETATLAQQLEAQTGYTAETWQMNNEQSLAGKKIRDIIANSVVITILIVAGFGIYNILNMVIYEKIKEIAILKATGFKGRHVVAIFIQQALLIGVIGSLAGLGFGWLFSFLVSKMYIGLGNVNYLPIAFEARYYIQGAVFGIVTAFFAGYIPAIKASKVDPVQIIRG